MKRIVGINKKKEIKIIGYYKQTKLDYNFYKEYRINNISIGKFGSKFELWQKGNKEIYELKVSGEYNIENATSAICVAKEYEITYNQIIKALTQFEGVKRRFELVGEVHNVKVYDDYGHHPTALENVYKMARHIYPNTRIIAVFEPYLWSRFNVFYKKFIEVLCLYDKAWITTLNIGREDKENIDHDKLGYIEKYALARNIKYLGYDDIIDELILYVKPTDVVISFVDCEKYPRKILAAISKHFY